MASLLTMYACVRWSLWRSTSFQLRKDDRADVNCFTDAKALAALISATPRPRLSRNPLNVAH